MSKYIEEYITDCCEAAPVEHSMDMGICPKCKDHCTYIQLGWEYLRGILDEGWANEDILIKFMDNFGLDSYQEALIEVEAICADHGDGTHDSTQEEKDAANLEEYCGNLISQQIKDENVKVQQIKNKIVMSEIIAKLKANDLTGAIIIDSPDTSEFKLHLSASWNCITHEDGGVRFKTNPSDTDEKKGQLITKTAGMVMTMLQLSESNVEAFNKLAVLLATKMDITCIMEKLDDDAF